MAVVLLVEDDAAIAEPVRRALAREGHEVTLATSGAGALDVLADGGVDLVVLDLGLPDVDGLVVCRAARRQAPDLPILLLTARADELDVITGLDAGADDYVTKPFRLGELLARVRARLRAQGETGAGANGVRVDLAARRAWLDGDELDLPAKEFDLLALLVASAGRVVTRERIMSEVWDQHWAGTTRTLDVHISSLRRRLGDDLHAPRHIATVRGVGFRFERE